MEGFGRTIVEAMNYGIPVIANASGGVLEIIEDNKNGLLYDSSIENLTDVVIKVLSDKELYESLSYNGRHQAKKYSVTNYVNAIDSILIETCL